VLGTVALGIDVVPTLPLPDARQAPQGAEVGDRIGVDVRFVENVGGDSHCSFKSHAQRMLATKRPESRELPDANNPQCLVGISAIVGEKQ
jgi:hypothetical protein